jgi:hypothetical protein
VIAARKRRPPAQTWACVQDYANAKSEAVQAIMARAPAS